MDLLSDLRSSVANARDALTLHGAPSAYDQGIRDGLAVALVYIDRAMVRDAERLTREAGAVFGGVIDGGDDDGPVHDEPTSFYTDTDA